jgi:hypothetical protein
VRHQYRDDELIVRRFEQCLSEDVLTDTIVNRKLPDTRLHRCRVSDELRNVLPALKWKKPNFAKLHAMLRVGYPVLFEFLLNERGYGACR